MSAALSLSLTLLICVAAPRVPVDESPPVVGRPADLPFSGASARFLARPGRVSEVPFVLGANVKPATTKVNAPVQLLVTVWAKGKLIRPPRRIDLRQVPAFADEFFIEDLTDGRKERIGPTTWEFAYRLRPRTEQVKAVPGVPFVYYNPDLKPVEKAFQVIYTDPVQLNVDREDRLAMPVAAPDSVRELAEGSSVWTSRPDWPVPGVIGWTLVLLVPPIVAILWVVVWRRLYPDAARQAELRRNRAARQALRALERADRQKGRTRAEQVAGALTGYLRQRLDLQAEEATWAEVSACLELARRERVTSPPAPLWSGAGQGQGLGPGAERGDQKAARRAASDVFLPPLRAGEGGRGGEVQVGEDKATSSEEVFLATARDLWALLDAARFRPDEVPAPDLVDRARRFVLNVEDECTPSA